MKNKMFYIDKNETIEDILKQIKEFFEYDSGIVCDGDGKVAYFKEDTFNQLLDYITNLQEEKDKFKLRCFKALKLIRDNYGILDKYGIDMLDDILNGDEE